MNLFANDCFCNDATLVKHYLCSVQYTLKKSLGQHFLRDEKISARIVEAIIAEKPSRLLEIGPGAGAITKYLLPHDEMEYLAFEVDEEKVTFLQKNYPAHQQQFLLQDVLTADPPFEGEFMVAGNFPYNISSQILFKILDWQAQVPVMVGMFQKEVADRVAAAPGSRTYGIISVLVQAFYEVDLLFHVEPGAFNPPPKVRSSVIRMRRRTEFPAMTSKADFFKLVKAAFNQRRKMLRNGLKQLMHPSILQDSFFDKRAEQLSVKEFAALTFQLNSSKNTSKEL
ncbi:MAG: ribosomal RNA small subunit methyltransferase A [Bacteroidetes bacterium]|nr:ribosomal RNA small subunit methyltransferase A [Bacteroidota bacterium]